MNGKGNNALQKGKIGLHRRTRKKDYSLNTSSKTANCCGITIALPPKGFKNKKTLRTLCRCFYLIFIPITLFLGINLAPCVSLSVPRQ